MRRWTAIALVVLVVLLVAAAAWQLLLAGRDAEYPGPTEGTPLPPALTASP